MASSADEPLSPLDAFRAEFRTDIEFDAVRPLADYFERFPGADADIAAEYRAAIRLPSEPTGEMGGAPGDRIAHYRILEQIGRGGQATVYLAEDTRLHRQVALKVLDPGFASDPTVFERFRREAEITSKLDHPGICTVYETGEDRAVLWIAMRYVEGDSIAKKISTAKEGLASGSTGTFLVLAEREGRKDTEDGRPPADSRTGPKTWGEIARVLALFEEAARALHVAHEAGVIHRDIKPGNMIVTKRGDPVILDFGLAQDLAGDHPPLTLTGDIMGTPAYMSPEQVAAQRINLDRRTDVYSLGVSLYECLALRRPFDSPTRAGLYQAIMTKDPPDLRSLNPAIPSDLRVVVATALEKDRDRRYQTALDLAEELRRVRMHEPIVAKPVGPIARLRRWAQRNPALAATLAGLIAVLATGFVVALILLRKSESERLAKEQALSQITLERNDKEAALTEYDRLGDLAKLEQLIDQGDSLWPATPANIPAYKAWLVKADLIKRRVGEHEAVIERLRTAALPYTLGDLARDISTRFPEHDREQAYLTALWGRAGADSSTRPDFRHRFPWNRINQSSSEALVNPPLSREPLEKMNDAEWSSEVFVDQDFVKDFRSWRFESPSDQFKHDATAKLLKQASALSDSASGPGLTSLIQARLGFAETVEQVTFWRYRDAWTAACKSIANPADCPKYAGLKINPQLGLVPIGKDPASGLWEFAHLQTTATDTDPIPKRGKDGGLIVTESMGLVFVLVPGGTFQMGAVTPDQDHPADSPNVDSDAQPDEGPIKSVRLDAFFISKFELTWAQWKRVGGSDPTLFPVEVIDSVGNVYVAKIKSPKGPVTHVSADDCEVWLRRIGLVMPTEAQWEYSARGGTASPRWYGTGTERLRTAAHIDTETRRSLMPSPVGSRAPNPFGLHDVLGNVFEWCRDGYGSYDVASDPTDGFRRTKDPRIRIVRGGAFDQPDSRARSASRVLRMSDKRSENIGVRPVRTVSN